MWTSRGDATWEVDVFGRIKRSLEASRASLEASIEDYYDIQVALYAEIALNYVQVRALQERISYAEQNIELQKQTLQLTQDRLKAESAPELDVRQAELNLAGTESVIPALQTQLTEAVNRIAVLVGAQPGTLGEQLLSAPGPVPSRPEQAGTQQALLQYDQAVLLALEDVEDAMVPYALFGAMLATLARSLDNNIYPQIGLVLLIGLSAKRPS